MFVLALGGPCHRISAPIPQAHARQQLHTPSPPSPAAVQRSPHCAGARPWVPAPCEVVPLGREGERSLLPAPPSEPGLWSWAGDSGKPL